MPVARLILLCAALVGCATATPQGEAVAPEAYIEAIRGNTQVGTSTEGGANWRLYVAQDLTRRGVVFLPNGRRTITGYVVARQAGVCSASPELRNGEERCVQNFRNGDTYQSVYQGRIDSTFRIEPGNPFGL